MIQDIEPSVFSNAYSSEPACDAARVFVFDGRVLLLSENEDGTLMLPSAAEFCADGRNVSCRLVRLFTIDETPFYLAMRGKYDDPKPEVPGYDYSFMMTHRVARPFWMRFAIATAYQLSEWYETNRHCGKCGHELGIAETERMLACPQCGNHVYPRINPAVIVAVRNGDSLLMTRYAVHANEYRERALIAGFCEIGETAEQTVAREVMEEAGVRVRNIRYYGSQPWGFASDLLVGFVCDLDGDPTISLNDGELSYAEWVPRDEIFEEEDHISLTREMVCAFKRGEL